MKRNHQYIAVEIENRREAPFLDLTEGAVRKEIALTTMVDNQKRAIVRIFFLQDEKELLLKEYDLSHLNPKPAGPPRFKLMGKYDGSRYLHIRLSVDNKLHDSSDIDLKRITKHRSSLPLLFLTLVLVLGGLTAFLFIGLKREPIQTADNSQTISSKQEQKDGSNGINERELLPKQEQEPIAQEKSQETAEIKPEQEGPDNNSEKEKTIKETEQERVEDKEDPPPLILTKTSARFRFRPNDAQLLSEAKQKLDDFVREVAGWEDLTIRVEGHCALFGSEKGREDLSRDRAEAGAAYLRSKPELKDAEIESSWHAGRKPISRDWENQEVNRRIEIYAAGKK